MEVQGVVLEEEYDKEREIRVTTVRIETENVRDYGETSRNISDD